LGSPWDIHQDHVNAALAFAGEGAWGTANEPACLPAGIALAEAGLGYTWWLLLHQYRSGG